MMSPNDISLLILSFHDLSLMLIVLLGKDIGSVSDVSEMHVTFILKVG
jgi:hypothetical protein